MFIILHSHDIYNWEHLHNFVKLKVHRNDIGTRENSFIEIYKTAMMNVWGLGI